MKMSTAKLKNTNLKMMNCSKEKLKEFDFKYNTRLSDVDNSYYTYKFPVAKYKKITTLEAELIVNSSTGIVNINVSDQNGTPYAPWYNDKYSTHNLNVLNANKKIAAKCKMFGIKKVKL